MDTIKTGIMIPAPLRNLLQNGTALTDDELLEKYDQARGYLQTRLFRIDEPPPRPGPRFSINGQAVSTPGNITTVIAQSKAGKTAFTGAFIAAALVASASMPRHTASRPDTLGVTATPTGGRILLHIDTEQSPPDAYEVVLKAMRRAGESAPPWLRSLRLAGLSPTQLRTALHTMMHEAAQIGIFAVIIDGAADMVSDVNDATECNSFISELHSTAIHYDCPIVCVVHENPGLKGGGKMRGHLGSQLERKAEANIRLQKTGDTTVVFSEKMRRAPILQKDGPRFAWSDEHQMHMTTNQSPRDRESIKRETLLEIAKGVFSAAKDKEAMTWTRLRDGIASFHGGRQCGAGKKLDEMRDLEVIEKDDRGIYSIVITPKHTNTQTTPKL